MASVQGFPHNQIPLLNNPVAAAQISANLPPGAEKVSELLDLEDFDFSEIAESNTPIDNNTAKIEPKLNVFYQHIEAKPSASPNLISQKFYLQKSPQDQRNFQEAYVNVGGVFHRMFHVDEAMKKLGIENEPFSPLIDGKKFINLKLGLALNEKQSKNVQLAAMAQAAFFAKERKKAEDKIKKEEDEKEFQREQGRLQNEKAHTIHTQETVKQPLDVVKKPLSVESKILEEEIIIGDLEDKKYHNKLDKKTEKKAKDKKQKKHNVNEQKVKIINQEDILKTDKKARELAPHKVKPVQSKRPKPSKTTNFA